MKAKIISLLLLLTPTLADAKVYQKGVASWYGKENKVSAAGKRLHNNIPAAAHKTLPLGSKVKITSLRTKKSVVVVIVDRGPYKHGRIIDVNLLAATTLTDSLSHFFVLHLVYEVYGDVFASNLRLVLMNDDYEKV